LSTIFFTIASPMPVPAYFSPAMQSLKYLEDFILIFRLETYTVIGYTKM